MENPIAIRQVVISKRRDFHVFMTGSDRSLNSCLGEWSMIEEDEDGDYTYKVHYQSLELYPLTQ